MIPKLPVLDRRRLAADFSRLVRESLTPAQLRRANQENARGGPHDAIGEYVEGNDLMAAAIAKQAGESWHWSEFIDDINAAWDRARAHQFSLMRVLSGCEYSGTVRDAFAAKGHSVLSCDTLPTDAPGPHYQGDVRDVMNDGFELMAAFPPCTYLASSQWFRCTRDPERMKKSIQALHFVAELFGAKVPKLALENPVGRISTQIAKPAQYVQPYEFGHDASKNTGLWLINLPKLIADPAKLIAPRIIEYRGKLVRRWANQSPCGADKRGPSKDRGHKRSKFYQGIADAMAEQWTPRTV